MRKAAGRETTGKKKSRKTDKSKKTAGKRSSPKPALRRAFDADALLNSMDGMVFVTSPDYRIEYMNEPARRKIGRDMTGKHCFMVFHGLEERCPWCMGELVLQGQTVRQEIQGQLDKRWYSNVITPLYRKDGSVAIQALVFDITDQKQAQAALVQSEAILRSIHQAAPMGIGVVKSRVLDWTNEQISRMTGYTSEELRGKSARIFYADDEEFDRVGRHKYADIRSKGTGSIVTVWRCKDGRLINVYLSSTPIDPGDLLAGVVFTALDITEQKMAQDELWRSEEKYRTLFESAVMGIFQSTPEGRFITVNPATAKMCGYGSPEEMVAGITDIATRHYVDPAERNLFIRAIEEQGFVRNFEHRTYRKDGSVFWVSVNARAVKDRRGNIICYEGTHEDVQWRKESEEALRASEERFSKAFRTNPAPVAISTIDEGRYIDANDRFLGMFGFNRDEVIGRTSEELGVWADRSQRNELIAQLREKGRVKNAPVLRKTKTGDTRHTLWSAEIIKLGDKDVLLTLHQDITEQKEAEEKLRQSEEKYRHFFENTLVGVFQSSLEGRYISTNPALARIYGYGSPDEVVSSVTDIAAQIFVDAEDRKRCVRILEEKGVLERFETRTRRKDGSIIWTVINSRFVRDADGRPLLIEGIIEDISDKKKAEEALKESQRLLADIIDFLPDATLVIDRDGKVIAWNRAIEKMTGFRAADMLGKGDFEYAIPFYGERRPILIDLALKPDTGLEQEKYVTTERAANLLTGEAYMPALRGGKVYLQGTASVLRNAAGEIIGAIESIRDITDRRNVEMALRESLATAQGILNAATETVFLMDLTGRVLALNETAACRLGKNVNEMLGTSIFDNLPVYVAAHRRHQSSEVVRLKQPVRFVDRRAGRWFESTLYPIFDVAGNVVRIAVYAQDVTERRQAEDARKLNEQRLEALQALNQMSHATIQDLSDFALEEGVRLTGSRIGYLAFLNKDESVMTMFSWSRAAMELCAVRDVTHVYPVETTGLWGEAVRQRRAVITNDYAAPCEFKKGTPDGHVNVNRHMNVPIFDGERIVAVAGVGNKDTDYDESDVIQLSLLIQGMWRLIQRRLSEEALRASEERFIKVFQSNPIPMTIATIDEGRLIDVNERVVELSGYSREELIGRSAVEVGLWAHPQERDRLIAILRETGSLRDGMAHFRTKAGDVKPALWSADAIPLGEKTVLLTAIQDITERKRAEETRLKLEAQLRQAQKMEAVGTLAGGIAHDFNNILFAVIGYTELCLQDILDEDNRWNLSQILSACSRAKSLVNQILAFSRQVEQERKPLDVVPLAKEAVKFLRSSLPATIDLSLDAAAGSSIILGDATQIHQVIMNLSTNAAHAMRASGGRLRIVIDNAGPPSDAMRGDEENGRSERFVHLGVSDTGHGIEPDHLNRIFDPFFTTKAPGEGTGLGLSVVYGIVKSLGGTIHVESTAGKGSTFDIYLPAIVLERTEPANAAEPLPRGTESILFVDDESHLVEVMGQMLTALGYRVTTVMESQKAFETFLNNPERFDLVITDMTMPGMTGAELAREILRRRPETPIILCTGYSDLINEQEALEMGIRRFLMKPLFMGNVAREIRSVLDEHGRRPAT